MSDLGFCIIWNSCPQRALDIAQPLTSAPASSRVNLCLCVHRFLYISFNFGKKQKSSAKKRKCWEKIIWVEASAKFTKRNHEKSVAEKSVRFWLRGYKRKHQPQLQSCMCVYVSPFCGWMYLRDERHMSWTGKRAKVNQVCLDPLQENCWF